VWITRTGRTSGSFSHNVLMVIYGEDGKSAELTLTRGQLCKDQLASEKFEVKPLFDVRSTLEINGHSFIPGVSAGEL